MDSKNLRYDYDIWYNFINTLLYNRMSYKIGYTVSTYIKGRNDAFMLLFMKLDMFI